MTACGARTECGAYGAGKPALLRPVHFTRVRAARVDFTNDYYRPFARRFARAVREVDPRALVFIEAEANRQPPSWSAADGGNVVFAPHWYDDILLARKHLTSWMAVDSSVMKVVLGRKAARRSLRNQLARLARAAREKAGGIPTLLAEFGVPFDLDGGRVTGRETSAPRRKRSSEASPPSRRTCSAAPSGTTTRRTRTRAGTSGTVRTCRSSARTSAGMPETSIAEAGDCARSCGPTRAPRRGRRSACASTCIGAPSSSSSATTPARARPRRSLFPGSSTPAATRWL